MHKASYDEFTAIDIRCGRIRRAEPFPEARKPAYKLTIDFGPEIGIKRSSAQITERYTVDDLTGTLVAAVVNLAPKQIGPFLSEVLVLGFADDAGRIVLVRPEEDVPEGARLH